MTIIHSDSCPCMSGAIYEACCYPIHVGQKEADTAEQLMRSRYTAFVNQDADYILKTMCGPASIGSDKASLLRSMKQTNWQSLSVFDHQQTEPNKATVHFKAFYEAEGVLGVLEERSEFVFKDGRWFYYDALID